MTKSTPQIKFLITWKSTPKVEDGYLYSDNYEMDILTASDTPKYIEIVQSVSDSIHKFGPVDFEKLREDKLIFFTVKAKYNDKKYSHTETSACDPNEHEICGTEGNIANVSLRFASCLTHVCDQVLKFKENSNVRPEKMDTRK